jgi:ABC-type nickel/cobalt efflux system permease component RcnA
VAGIDERIASLSSGAGLVVALAVALLLGLRHATDPDHLTAVSTLALSDAERGPRRAAALGAAWGAGHALTLAACALPVVLLHATMPAAFQRGAELAVGALIAALAARLLRRWRRGYFDLHAHDHGAMRHVHVHMHEDRAEPGHAHPAHHEHRHPDALGRSPAMAFAIGLVHGVGGSAGVTVLLLSAVPGRATATLALGIFASATALSMALVSLAFGGLLSRETVARRLERTVPALGVLSLAFGVVWVVRAASSFTA